MVVYNEAWDLSSITYLNADPRAKGDRRDDPGAQHVAGTVAEPDGLPSRGEPSDRREDARRR